METLDAGKTVKVKTVKGEEVEVFVRQLPLKDYKPGFLKSDDEFELVALFVGKHVDWVYNLEPDSYELLLHTGKEVNANGFFVYCNRRNKELTERMNLLSPELATKVAQAGQASNAGLPRSVPRPV